MIPDDIDGTDGFAAPPAPFFSAERILQAAAEGTLTAPDLDRDDDRSYVAIGSTELTGEDMPPLDELLWSGHLTWVGAVIAPTVLGRDLLARWRTSEPTLCDRRIHGGEQT